VQSKRHVVLVDIKCGKRISAILGSNGSLWMVGNYKSEKTFKKEPTAAEKEAIQMQKDKEFA